jgi:hypothetical protein
MPPTSIFPFIYCFVVTFSMLAMIVSPALIGFLFNNGVEPKAHWGWIDWLCYRNIGANQISWVILPSKDRGDPSFW